MNTSPQRLRLELRGAVQGVGFRPFVYRLAREMNLAGFVTNTSQGAVIEVEGPSPDLARFFQRVQDDKPPHCRVDEHRRSIQSPVGDRTFVIRESADDGPKTSRILPDLATCPDCIRDIFDPTNRRYRYPFTNCTNCGPRFSIIEAIPYDRANTTMRSFPLCDECRVEYEDPTDRRFHAQPNACPRCGPHLELWRRDGEVLAAQDDALGQASDAIRTGSIVAVKGLGGFHLFVDATTDEAVRRLRERKRRDEKPFALMMPSLEAAREHCDIASEETQWLTSPVAPIVLLQRTETCFIAPSVAPGNPYLGVMLPYTPLHHLLMADLQAPVVATSGNLSDEPICTDEREALERLGSIADLFLVHNRPIARPMEDSVMQIVLGKEQFLRTGRGVAPLSILLSEPLPPLLAVGGHLKNTFAVAVGDRVVLGQHVGDLETLQARRAFERSLHDLPRLHNLQLEGVVCDLHPDYASTEVAEDMRLPIRHVQHHEAHVRACMAEHGLTGPVLGVAWDGTGFGTDGTTWGGEFLRVGPKQCERIAHFRPFRLPGGETAIREPRRAALGILFELFGETLCQQTEFAPLHGLKPSELHVLVAMLRKGLHAPITTSVGRLFDAVASLCGLRQIAHFEGQAAMDVQFARDGTACDDGYSLTFGPGGIIDWEPMFRELLVDCRQACTPAQISARFHTALAKVIVEVARQRGERNVVLGGGCFQNRWLLEQAVQKLREAGFVPYWPQRVPPNDGGLALGQIAAWSSSE